MEDYFNLKRFTEAQNSFNTYEKALQEVKAGWKQTHWIWYVFPQMRGLGQSDMSLHFGISSLLEAKAYLEDDCLRSRLYEVTRALYMHNGSLSPEDIFGGLDAMKVRSCMTLFDIVSPCDIFGDVLRDCYHEARCERTIEMTAGELSSYREDDPLRKYHLNGKALLEGGSSESDEIPFECRLGTLLDLSVRSCRVSDLVRSYLYETDMSQYRTSGIESTLTFYLSTFGFHLIDSTGNAELQKVIAGIIGEDDDIDLFEAARRLDNLLYESWHIPEFGKIIGEFKQKSIISEKQCWEQ